MFSYILVAFTGYILLISICSILKGGKRHSIASSALLAYLFKNYFKSAKTWLLVAQLYKNSVDCFVLEVSTVGTVIKF